jgi:hypothetical protein
MGQIARCVAWCWLLALGVAPARAAYPYDSACQVAVQKSPRRVVGGSGVLIGVSGEKALVLTVRHVALRAGLPVTCEWAGSVSHGKVLAVSPDSDVALLVVDRPPGVQPVPVAMPSAASGPFVLVGFPGYDRDTMRWQRGEFVAVEYDQLVVTCRPEKGMSGGPAFDRYGRVVGTVSAFGPRYGFCGSGAAMFDLLDDYLKGLK